jgi:Peptidase M15
MAAGADMAVPRLTSRLRKFASAAAIAIAVIAIVGCGSSSTSQSAHGADSAASGAGTPDARAPRAHPQAIQPAAGVQADASGGVAAGAGAVPPAVGDVNAHAPPLQQVKRELKQLNLCGGVTDGADAAPVVQAATAGFAPDPGTSQTQGQLPVLTAQLDALGKALRVTIYGISGYRTPAHSVAVGGYAHDPHTQGEAEDIGVNSLLRASAAQISESELARFGLYRPFDPSDDPGNTEVNHIQLIPSGGPLTLAQSQAAWDPDPACR